MMRNQRILSDVTKTYLNRFYEILDTMIQGMTSVRLSNSISHNYIMQMIPHHEAAIAMSRNVLQFTTFIPVQNIANHIINEQTRSIRNLKNALISCSRVSNAGLDLCLYQRRFNQATQRMFVEMGSACTTNNINANFMQEMIPHHRGAIQMSENALQFNLCPELSPIIHAIVTSQRAGIRRMQRLLLQCN